MAEQLYDRIVATGGFYNEVVLDDRVDLSIGQRLRLARQSGYPFAICIGKEVRMG